MGLFNKKVKNLEINQINNIEYKNKIGDTAVSLLLNQKLIVEDELKYVQVEYGYLYSKADGVVEALLKINFNSKTFYFGVQNEHLSMLNIIELQYIGLIKSMVDYHECLKKDEINESNKQKNRRIKNNKYLSSNGIAFNEKLPCYVNDEDIKTKSIDEICKRALASLLTIQIACDINNKNYKESLAHFSPLYKEFNVENCLNSKEQRIVDGTYTDQDLIDMDWAYEAYWSICWCLGLVDDIKNANVLCDCNKAISFVVEASSFDDFKNKCKLRSLDEILDMQDLYYRYNWAINDCKVHPNSMSSSLNYSNVIERRRGLEWIISSEKDWYDLRLSA